MPVARPRFERWRDPPVAFTFGGKPTLTYDGQPVFAELLILRLLEQSGWSGVWVEDYGGTSYLREMPSDSSLTPKVDLPAARAALLDKIRLSARRGGTPDVYAWFGASILFCEAKRRHHDRLRPTQLRWFDAALDCGVSPDAMLTVEWSYSDEGEDHR
jgi:hypothetical protein